MRISNNNPLYHLKNPAFFLFFAKTLKPATNRKYKTRKTRLSLSCDFIAYTKIYQSASQSVNQ